MMADVFRTRQANTDLLEIWIYIAENAPEAADQVLEAIGQRCQTVAEMPGMGRSRDDLAPSLRSIPEGNYVIFYRPIEGGIQVIRVLHGARDTRDVFG